MRIYYDGAIYSISKIRPGGISNFFDHLISRVSMQHNCLLSTSRPSDLPGPSGTHLQIVRHNLQAQPRRFNYLYQKYFSLRLRQFRPTLIHYTYYSEPAAWHMQIPLIYTAFDMIHEKWPEEIDPDGQNGLLKRRCFDNASAIPCISESTRNDLLELYPYLEKKTTVIYLAGDLKLQPKHEVSMQLVDSLGYFLLYVGARKSYKNFIRLLLAFARVVSQYPLMRLKVAGAPFNVYEKNLVEALGVQDRVDLYCDPSDEFLYSLYRQALAFIYPSLYEGFGIPLLEAMALDCPVLASNTSSIPEVTGNAALLFNPYSIDAIYDAIIQIVRRPGLRGELIEKGRQRLTLFSWERTAGNYLELYEKLARTARD